MAAEENKYTRKCKTCGQVLDLNRFGSQVIVHPETKVPQLYHRRECKQCIAVKNGKKQGPLKGKITPDELATIKANKEFFDKESVIAFHRRCNLGLSLDAFRRYCRLGEIQKLF